MLQNIHVKNIALIKEIDIEFGRGLNVVTGETGAGKSLILGSVGMGVGLKGTKHFITNDDEEALIELSFQGYSDEVEKILLDNKVSIEDDTIILQRKIKKNRTVNRINYQTVSLATLKAVGSRLIQLHGQHDNQLLLDRREHRKLLDCYGEGILTLVQDYNKDYKKLIEINKAIEDLELSKTNRTKDIDYYRYVINEIESANLRLGEDEELREAYKKMVTMKNSMEDISRVYMTLSDEVYEGVSTSLGCFEGMKDVDETSQLVYAQLLEVEILVQNVLSDLGSLKDEGEIDEEYFSHIDRRIDELNNIKQKYGGSIEEAIIFKDEILARLEYLVNADANLSNLITEKKEVSEGLELKSDKLTKARKSAATKMEKKMATILEELNFQAVDFKVMIQPLTEFRENGKDEVEFYISTNVGVELRELSQVASGGELSRIMLALQSIISDLYVVDSMIFDEIDAGISGKTASMVAKRLKEMAAHKQIVCVTHLAQIAAVGDVHFKIDKSVEDGVSTTQLSELDEQESIGEVARLLSGFEVTESTLQSAKELRSLFN